MPSDAGSAPEDAPAVAPPIASKEGSAAAPLTFAVLLAVAEGGLAAALLAAALPWAIWLVLHLAIVAAAVAWLIPERAVQTDRAPFWLSVLATAIGGAPGATLAVAALALLAREKPNVALMAAWYDRIALAGEIDAVSRLSNTVAMGRAIQTARPSPPEFERVMAQGSLEDRQTALGLIARRFSPSYASALRMALVSSEPVIRVQAAAVAVKVKAELKQSLAVALARAERVADDPAARARLAADLDAMASSRLLEEADQSAAVAARDGLLRNGFALTPEEVSRLDLDGAGQALVETQWLRAGRFADVRALRARARRAGPAMGGEAADV